MPYNIPIGALTQFLNSPATGYIQESGGGTGYDDGYTPASSGGYDDAADDAEDFLEEMDEDVLDRPEERKLHEHYKMEKKDPTHRMGDLMTAAESIYDDARAGKRSDDYNAKGQSFLPWLDGVPEWPRVVMMKETLQRFDRNKSEGITPSMVKAFISGVKYLDKAGRKNYRVDANGARMWKGDVAFDTTKLQTAFSGLGFAIWVLSPKDRFYAGSHKVGQFHHSSFLSGEKVLAAGEMVVSGGKLRLLTGKSGHYKPQLEHLAYAVELLGKQSIPLSTFRVQVWRSTCTNPVAPTAEEFIDAYRLNRNSWVGWSGCGCAAHQRLKRADWDK